VYEHYRELQLQKQHLYPLYPNIDRFQKWAFKSYLVLTSLQHLSITAPSAARIKPV
jgi:hypothetical protein